MQIDVGNPIPFNRIIYPLSKFRISRNKRAIALIFQTEDESGQTQTLQCQMLAKDALHLAGQIRNFASVVESD